MSSQLKTSLQQQRVARVSYRRGRGSTSQILGMSDKRDLEEIREAGRIWEKIIDGLNPTADRKRHESISC